MAGPLSIPEGKRDSKGHDRCQDRERCTGPGCRIRTGKTKHRGTDHGAARAVRALQAESAAGI